MMWVQIENKVDIVGVTIAMAPGGLSPPDLNPIIY